MASLNGEFAFVDTTQHNMRPASAAMETSSSHGSSSSIDSSSSRLSTSSSLSSASSMSSLRSSASCSAGFGGSISNSTPSTPRTLKRNVYVSHDNLTQTAARQTQTPATYSGSTSSSLLRALRADSATTADCNDEEDRFTQLPPMLSPRERRSSSVTLSAASTRKRKSLGNIYSPSREVQHASGSGTFAALGTPIGSTSGSRSPSAPVPYEGKRLSRKHIEASRRCAKEALEEDLRALDTIPGHVTSTSIVGDDFALDCYFTSLDYLLKAVKLDVEANDRTRKAIRSRLQAAVDALSRPEDALAPSHFDPLRLSTLGPLPAPSLNSTAPLSGQVVALMIACVALAWTPAASPMSFLLYIIVITVIGWLLFDTNHQRKMPPSDAMAPLQEPLTSQNHSLGATDLPFGLRVSTSTPTLASDDQVQSDGTADHSLASSLSLSSADLHSPRLADTQEVQQA